MPDLACVMADGGRYQRLDRSEADRKRGRGEHWKESRIGLLLSLESETHAVDPQPELPEFLADVSLAKTLAAIGRVPGGGGTPGGEPPGEEAANDAEASSRRDPPWLRPRIVARTVVASGEDWETFGPTLASTAWQAGFAAAKRKVFVSDGSAAIEGMRRRDFCEYVGVLDLMHALSYALAAARAIEAKDVAAAWALYVRWATAIWQGRVDDALADLDAFQAKLGEPDETCGDDDPREVVRRARVYYGNQREKMNYPEYRRQGFPLTSSLMESTVKQVNRRVKGSEKFWSTPGGEALLALRAERLSDASPLFDARSPLFAPAEPGYREYRTAA